MSLRFFFKNSYYLLEPNKTDGQDERNVKFIFDFRDLAKLHQSFLNANSKSLFYSPENKQISLDFNSVSNSKTLINILGNSFDLIVFSTPSLNQLIARDFAIAIDALKKGGFFVFFITDEEFESLSNFAKRFCFLLRQHSPRQTHNKNLDKIAKVSFTLKDDVKNEIKPKLQDKEEEVNLIANKKQGVNLSKQQKAIIQSCSEDFFAVKKKLSFLIANRGTGKSTTLAFLVIDLINKITQTPTKDDNHLFVISSLKLNQLQMLKHHLKNQLILLQDSNNFFDIKIKENKINLNLLNQAQMKVSFEIRIIPADYLLNDLFLLQNTKLLILDEIAALGLPLLNRVLDAINTKASKCLSSTMDGYEGSGRGLMHKFFKNLSRNDFNLFTLEHNFRFFADDWLAQFAASLFFYPDKKEFEFLRNRNKHENRGQEKLGQNLPSYEICTLACDDFFEDESLLRQVYTLLDATHYRNNQNFLQDLLNNQDLIIFALRLKDQSEKLVSVLIAQVEKVDVKNSYKRGSLGANQIYLRAGIHLKMLRILRIATLDDYRCLSYARSLVQQLELEYQSYNFFVSFGLDYINLTFWSEVGFKLFGLGQKKAASSSDVSALMLKAENIDERESQALQNAQKIFGKEILQFLAKTQVDAKTAVKILALQDFNIKHKVINAKLLKENLEKKLARDINLTSVLLNDIQILLWQKSKLILQDYRARKIDSKLLGALIDRFIYNLDCDENAFKTEDKSIYDEQGIIYLTSILQR